MQIDNKLKCEYKNITRFSLSTQNAFLSKFRSRDTGACVRSIGRTFLRSTLKVIQLSVLYHIFIDYKLGLVRRSL